MKPSRGMGAITQSKQPRTVIKKDGKEPVKLYSKGGGVEIKGKTKGKAR